MEGLNYHKIEIVVASPDPIFGADSWVDTLKEAALASRDEESEMNSFVTARCVESRGEFIDSDDEDTDDDDDDEENDDDKVHKVL